MRIPWNVVATAGIGAAVSTGHPLGIAVSIAMPAIVLNRHARRECYRAALVYYAAASWPIIPAARQFFGPNPPELLALLLWTLAAAILAVPWWLVWTSDRSALLWRAPFALLLGAILPLGIIGWASPLTAAGILFPGTGWAGLLATMALAGGLAVWPSMTAATAAAVSLVLNLTMAPIPKLADWEGVNTSFGSVADSTTNPLQELRIIRSIQERALAPSARVIVFPESVIPRWTEATEEFWQDAIAELRRSGKTIVVGALLPATRLREGEGPPYYGAQLTALRGQLTPVPLQSSRQRSPYRNAVLIRGMDTGTFEQRIPVPASMWNPHSESGVRLNLGGRSTINVGQQQAAILVCYEQLLVWPIITAVVQKPTAIVAVSNAHWVRDTPIPRYQASALHLWSRLFGIPTISAVNR